MSSNLPRRLSRSILPCVAITVLGLQIASNSAENLDLAKAKSGEILDTTKVWEIHLKFSKDQYEAMEPKGGGFGFGGGGGGGRGGGFGPGMFLAPAFLEQGDTSKDGKLTREEFGALGEKWFADWDKEKAGKIDAEQLKAGLNTSLGPPPGGRRGGPPGGGMNFLGKEGGRNGLSAMTGVEFTYVHADLEFGGKSFTNVAVRYKGNGTFMESRATTKRSMKIQLDEYVKGQKLAGMGTLNLHNNVTDPSWMNEVLSHRLYRDAGVPAPRTSYAKVYTTVAGKHEKRYVGLYSLIENPDKTFAEARFGTKAGAIFKPVGRRLFEDLGDDWAKYNQTYDPKTKLTEEQKKRVIDFAKLLSNADDEKFAAQLPNFLDIEQFARFMAVTTWLSTLDSILGMGQNFLVYLHPESKKFQFMPWDLDHSFGQFHLMGSQEQREELSIRQPWHSDVKFLQRVFKVDAFMKVYLARMEEFSKTIFEPKRFHQQVDEIAASLRPAVKEESSMKLDRFEKVAAGEPVAPAAMGGFGMNMPPRKPIKGFVDARAKSVKDQLTGKSEGKQVAFGGFGGPPGGGEGRRGGPGGRGGPPGGFGPGNWVAQPMFNLLDSDKDASVTRSEFKAGFEKLFIKWDKANQGTLDEDALKAGMNEDLAPRGGFPGPGGRGGPPGGPPGDVVRPAP